MPSPTLAPPGFWSRGREADTTGVPVPPSVPFLLSQQPRGFFYYFILDGQFADHLLQLVRRLARLISLRAGLLLGIAFILEGTFCMGLKLFLEADAASNWGPQISYTPLLAWCHAACFPALLSV